MRYFKIEIDENIWNYLKSKAEPFEDTPNMVLNRILFGDNIHEVFTNKLTKIDDNPLTLPVGTPKSLAQILEVIYEIRKFNRSRTEATNIVARRRNTAPQTIIDKYCRQLSKKAYEIDNYLQEQNLKGFKILLLNKFNNHQDLINSFFNDLQNSETDEFPISEQKSIIKRQAYKGKKIMDTIVEEDIQIGTIAVTRNRSSEKYFIYIEAIRDDNDAVINPVGKKIPFKEELYEDIEDIDTQKLLSDSLINKEQLNEYKKHKKLERYHDDLQQDKASKRISYGGGKFSFNFTINKSFLEDGKITTPKEFNSLLAGSVAQHDKCKISIISINGSALDGYLYYGESGGGDYFQIWMKNKPEFICQGGLENKEIGDTILVVFEGDIHSLKFILQ